MSSRLSKAKTNKPLISNNNTIVELPASLEHEIDSEKDTAIRVLLKLGMSAAKTSSLKFKLGDNM